MSGDRNASRARTDSNVTVNHDPTAIVITATSSRMPFQAELAGWSCSAGVEMPRAVDVDSLPANARKESDQSAPSSTVVTCATTRGVASTMPAPADPRLGGSSANAAARLPRWRASP
jgi:hypothetical protein